MLNQNEQKIGHLNELDKQLQIMYYGKDGSESFLWGQAYHAEESEYENYVKAYEKALGMGKEALDEKLENYGYNDLSFLFE